MRNFQPSVIIYLGDRIKKSETGEACGTHEGEDWCIQGLGGGVPERQRLFGRPKSGWKNIIKKVPYRNRVGEGTWNVLIWLRLRVTCWLL